ncbi:GNAT family N-acetyltransferase [Edaphobacter dinghuensis]|uniref:N-acetyltransferase domain-containing protein n=1 Tax=Edaphobacter dinghuensis TaxID=1560005 RepID=A0A917HHN2_9BACT|nr:GNAT family N-acetyltransferase [Edaphobacter dinghuensis]GGG78932.1 hypothetical protein GCM10011585_22710 [Edaphobacter dinghuensis]
MSDSLAGHPKVTSHAPTFTVRPMLLEDAKEISVLSAQLGYQASSEAIAQRIVQMSSHTGSHAAFVTCMQSMQADEVIGWIEVTIMHELQSPSFALITGLVVNDAYRSQGIGKRLCAEVEAWSREQGVAKIRVTSRIAREDAHRFYLREGFERIKTWAVFEKMLS